MEGLTSIQTRKELQAKNFEREAPSARAHNMQHLKQLKSTDSNGECAERKGHEA
jgi:hypothetical protein